MRKYDDTFILNKLKDKADSLGRSPRKDEIDADKSMPHSSCYARFGGLSEALRLIDLPPNRVTNLTIDYYIEKVLEFYKEYSKVPTTSDFDATPNYPHSSYIRKDLELTWNQLLLMAGLPVLTNGEAWVKNVKAEMIVKKYLEEANIEFEYLSLENTNASHSFILKNGITIDARYSSPIMDKNNTFWKFKLHLNSKKEIPDYFICVGFDENDQYDSMFLVPTSEIGKKQQVISINTKRMERSKYFRYKVEKLNGGWSGIKDIR